MDNFANFMNPPVDLDDDELSDGYMGDPMNDPENFSILKQEGKNNYNKEEKYMYSFGKDDVDFKFEFEKALEESDFSNIIINNKIDKNSLSNISSSESYELGIGDDIDLEELFSNVKKIEEINNIEDSGMLRFDYFTCNSNNDIIAFSVNSVKYPNKTLCIGIILETKEERKIVTKEF